MFVHQTDLRAGTDITEGDTVEFGTADYKGREKAVDVIKVDPAPTHRRQGVCQWFDPERKKGFITPDGGGADVFVHQTGLRSGTEITDGDRVEFGTLDFVDGGRRRRRRTKAVDVIKVGPAAEIAKNAPKGPSLVELAGRAARDARSPRSRSRSRRRSRRRSPSRSGSRSRSRGRRRRDRPPTSARRHRGVYRDAKGHELKRYGFITADVGPTDIFTHLDDVREGHVVKHGDSVEYTLVPCRRTGKERAVGVVKLPSWVPDGTIAARTKKMLAGDRFTGDRFFTGYHSIKAQFDDGTLTVRTLRAAVAESLGVEEAAVKKVVKQTLTAALEAAKARSPQPPPSEVSDDSGAAAPALVIDVGSPRKRDRSRGRAPTVDAELSTKRRSRHS
jgi:CspA family cold shock protein